MNTILKEQPFLFSCGISFLWVCRGGLGIRNQSVSLQTYIIHQECWGEKGDDAIHLSNGVLYRESLRTFCTLWDLSESLHGDKYHNYLIYLVDKRINCCYLRPTQAGCHCSSSMLGEGFLKEAGPREWCDGWMGKSVPSPGSQGIPGLGGRPLSCLL